MDKDFSNNSHWYDPQFNTKTDRKRDSHRPTGNRPRVKATGPGPEQTYIKYDPHTDRFVTIPGKIPIKRKNKSGKSKRRAERLAQRSTGWHCFWCNIPLSYNLEGGDTQANRTRLDVRYPTIDHVIELANGGPDSDENCVLSCQPCNSARNKTFKDRSPDVF